MSTAATRFNLRPQERRLVAFVGIVVFVVLNIWLVWPHFGDWTRLQLAKAKGERTLQSYKAEIGKSRGYQVRLRELESAGPSVVPEEQELDLARTADTLARASRMNVITSDPRQKTSASTQTNRFFEEQYVTLHATCDNDELINFLVSLTSTNSLIRVKDLTLKPADTAATKLDAQMTLVASYQRRPQTRSALPAAASSTNLAPVPKAAVPKPGAQRTLSKTNRASATFPTPTNRVSTPKNRLTNAPARKQ